MVGAWLLVAAVSALYAAACCAAVWAVGLSWWWGLLPVAIAVAGACTGLLLRVSEPDAPTDSVVIKPVDDARIHAVVDRLCALTGQDKPVVRLYGDGAPNALSFEPDTVYLSMGLVNRLDNRELEAVLAHELAHLAHRDERVLSFATLMGTMEWALTLPAMAGMLVAAAEGRVCRVARRCGRKWRSAFGASTGPRTPDGASTWLPTPPRPEERDEDKAFSPGAARVVIILAGLARAALILLFLAILFPALIVGVLAYGAALVPGRLVVLVLTRRREIAADRAAAELTGAPSVLAATLARLTKSIPLSGDLRGLGNASSQAFLPTSRLGKRKDRHPDDAIGKAMDRLWDSLRSTHPSVEARIKRLERQSARMTGPGDG